MAGLCAKVLPILLFSCVTANSAGRSDIDARDAPESRTLIGFDALGSMILLAESGEARAIRAFDLPRGPERTLLSFDGPVSDARMRSLMREQGWRDAETWHANAELGLWFHLEPSLGDRKNLEVFARADGVSISLLKIPVAGPSDVEKIALAPDGRYAIVQLRTHALATVFVVDLKEARSTLLDKRALDAYAAGDRALAAELLERAVEADPTAGDAIYNLACVHALEGDVERAADELSIALLLEPVRYRRLAKKDPDLVEVRNLPRIKASLGYPES